MDNAIRYIKRKDIDTLKWDRRLDKSANSLIYGYSFYLDRMAKHWDALVMGDYEVLMALPWNSKYGIQYLYQPAFTPICGFYGGEVSTALYEQFIAAIPKKFRLVEINVRATEISIDRPLMTNYILPLDKPYESLYANYRENIKRNIKKAREAGCTVQTKIPVSNIIQLAKEQLSNVVKINDRDLQQFENLYDFLRVQHHAVTYGIFSKTNELLASCVFFYGCNRAYYILVGNTANGKTLGASHYLVDRFIADHARSGYILDFEGSDISSLAFFYESFGATREMYVPVRKDRLPWYVKMISRYSR